MDGSDVRPPLVVVATVSLPGPPTLCNRQFITYTRMTTEFLDGW
jgi:hypothetical protein